MGTCNVSEEKQALPTLYLVIKICPPYKLQKKKKKKEKDKTEKKKSK